MFDFGNKISRGIDRIVDLKPVFFPDMKVVRTVAGCSVNTTRAGLSGRLVFKTHIELDLGVSLAERDVLAVHDQRRAIKPCMLCFETVEFRTLEARDLFVLGKPGRFGERLGEFGCDDENLGVRNFDRRVIEIGMHRDSHIRRQRPWSRCPDHKKYILAGERSVDLCRIRLERKLYIHRRRRVFLIFDLGFSKRGLIVDAPVHGRSPL